MQFSLLEKGYLVSTIIIKKHKRRLTFRWNSLDMSYSRKSCLCWEIVFQHKSVFRERIAYFLSFSVGSMSTISRQRQARRIMKVKFRGSGQPRPAVSPALSMPLVVRGRGRAHESDLACWFCHYCSVSRHNKKMKTGEVKASCNCSGINSMIA